MKMLIRENFVKSNKLRTKLHHRSYIHTHIYRYKIYKLYLQVLEKLHFCKVQRSHVQYRRQVLKGGNASATALSCELDRGSIVGHFLVPNSCFYLLLYLYYYPQFPHTYIIIVSGFYFTCFG